MSCFRARPETFLVEEIPAYPPSGEGSHTFVWIEKRGLTTPEAVRRLARALQVPDRDVGYAGLKDRHATTRQWLSLPGVDPELALACEVDGLRILEARRHGNKLRTGHLRGNRFEVSVEDLLPGEAAAIEARMSTLVAAGLPNRYGEQRFGSARDNARVGLALLRGTLRERDHRRRRFLLSALQSAVFNRVLELRALDGGLLLTRAGDVLKKTDTGGLFITNDPAADQLRVEAGEVVPTGPMPGGREVEPPPGSAARMMEERAMADLDAAPADFARAGRDLPGARRPVVVPVTGGEPTVAVDGARLILRFSLPAGSYATVLVEELGVEIVRDRSGPGPGPGQGDGDREPSGDSESSESLAPVGPPGP